MSHGREAICKRRPRDADAASSTARRRHLDVQMKQARTFRGGVGIIKRRCWRYLGSKLQAPRSKVQVLQVPRRDRVGSECVAGKYRGSEFQVTWHDEHKLQVANLKFVKFV